MKRLTVIAYYLVIIFTASLQAQGQYYPPPNQPQLRSAAIDKSKLPHNVTPQSSPVWCWAASISYVFAFYGHDVDQCNIIKQASSSQNCPINQAGNPRTMTAAFNSSWVDNDGNRFTSKSDITDDMWGSSKDIDNNDVIEALRNGHPVFFGNTHHAMVLIQASYVPSAGEPTILAGTVWDPEPPSRGGGIRQISGTDLQGKFAAIPDITDDASGGGHPPSPGQSQNLCSGLKRGIAQSGSIFSSIKGSKSGTGRWKASLAMGEFSSCQIYDIVNDGNLALICSGSNDSFASVNKSIKACLSNWNEQTRTNKRGPISTFSSSSTEYTVDLETNSKGDLEIWVSKD